MRSKVLQALAVGALGWFIGYWRELTLFDPFFLVPALCLSLIFVGPIVVKGISIRDAVLRACGMTLAVVLVAMLTVNVLWSGGLVMPPWAVFFSGLALSVSATTLVAILLKMASRFMRPGSVTWLYRLLVLGAVLAWRYVPGEPISDFLLRYGVVRTVLVLAASFAAVDLALLQGGYAVDNRTADR